MLRVTAAHLVTARMDRHVAPVAKLAKVNGCGNGCSEVRLLVHIGVRGPLGSPIGSPNGPTRLVVI